MASFCENVIPEKRLEQMVARGISLVTIFELLQQWPDEAIQKYVYDSDPDEDAGRPLVMMG